MESTELSYIIDIIYTKTKYNQQTKTYQIKESDYLNLKLTTKQKRILKQLCDKLYIELEYTRSTKNILPSSENENLFKEYNDLKSKIKNSKSTNSLLEIKRIELRNRIVLDNMLLVREIIDRRIDNLPKGNDIEEIYQLGYETLIDYIDNNYLYIGKFKTDISQIIIINITRKLTMLNEGISYYQKNNLDNIINNKEKDRTKKINELQQLKNILTAISLDNEIELLNHRNDNEDSVLFYDTFEIDLIENINKKNIISNIISTFQADEQEIINLYFGLNGNNPLDMKEIASKYKVSKTRICSIINKIINKTKKTYRINYLKELYKSNNTKINLIEEENRELEEFLIKQLPQETYNTIIKELNLEQQQFISLYHNNKEDNLPEIAIKMNVGRSQIYKIKNKTIKAIREIIINKVFSLSQKTITYEEYIDYLMNLYFKKKNTKIKKRVCK